MWYCRGVCNLYGAPLFIEASLPPLLLEEMWAIAMFFNSKWFGSAISTDMGLGAPSGQKPLRDLIAGKAHISVWKHQRSVCDTILCLSGGAIQHEADPSAYPSLRKHQETTLDNVPVLSWQWSPRRSMRQGVRFTYPSKQTLKVTFREG